MSRSPSKPALALLVAGEIIAAAFAWRDLAQRPDVTVRGGKKFWRVFIMINPGNSLAYWALGRR